MRRLLIFLMFVAVSGSLFAVISGSAHDFATAGWNGTGEICIVCHTPHNAMSTNGPLWNHTETSATFTLYSSPSLDATDLGQPAGVSKLCLSCHDGTVALDSFGGATGSTFITGTDNLGTDLSNDHPISFTYPSTDTGLFDPTTTSSGLGSTISADLLVGGKVECSSCHDVHNKYNLSYLLKISNAGSALCLVCHNK